MTSTTDVEKFRNRWEEHIAELARLKMSLDPKSVEWDEVEEVQDTLQDIVDTAARRFEEDDNE